MCAALEREYGGEDDAKCATKKTGDDDPSEDAHKFGLGMGKGRGLYRNKRQNLNF